MPTSARANVGIGPYATVGRGIPDAPDNQLKRRLPYEKMERPMERIAAI